MICIKKVREGIWKDDVIGWSKLFTDREGSAMPKD